MFKLATLTGVALGILSGVAMAADLPSRKAPPPVYIPPAPIATWTGFYLGLNAGAAIRVNNTNNNLYAYYFPAAFSAFGDTGGSDNNVGFVGGGQIGYNWQSGPIVFGLETDAQYRSSIGTQNNSLYGSGGNGGFYGTARGRVGYLVTPQLLFYITGGAAYGNTFTTNNVLFGGSSNSFKVGWTGGGGIEYAFSPNWSIKGEALYNDLGRTDVGGFGAGPRTQFIVARLGVNYKFNWGVPAPVVARY